MYVSQHSVARLIIDATSGAVCDDCVLADMDGYFASYHTCCMSSCTESAICERKLFIQEQITSQRVRACPVLSTGLTGTHTMHVVAGQGQELEAQ